jgi:plastocyanin
MKKEVSIGLILLLVVALLIIGISIYRQYTQPEEIIQDGAEEEEKEVVEIEVEEEPEIKEPSEVIISISRFEFDKPEITIKPGTTVIWNNTDTRKHMITNKTIGLFRRMRKSLEFGDTFEYTFNEPGVYEILEANFGINGKVIVEAEPNLITGQVVKNIEVNGLGFLLVSLNLFGISMVALIAGFYFSRRHHKE